jgi:hypothetical protein
MDIMLGPHPMQHNMEKRKKRKVRTRHMWDFKKFASAGLFLRSSGKLQDFPLHLRCATSALALLSVPPM